MPQNPFAPQYQPAPQPAVQPADHSAADRAAEEAKRMQEEKDKLERKINDMEKLLSAEKEKALLATLKNQQDENLSSRVESSLKDIQDKMRRDRRDHEVEEERLTLKAKIKEMETRLSQERETWMQTLKNQMTERETQGRDVEGHFIYRLQEMERRWLDEKAQWQKEISVREEELRSLKSSAEKLRDTQDELRKVSLEKSMIERDISKMKDEVARAEREKASIESYIKIIPEKERELAEVRADNIQLRAREAAALGEVKLRDEKTNFEIDKLQKQIGSLQAEIGAISDRKNTEKNEELRQLQARFEDQLQEKEKALADVNGEKVRAISELVKIKGFISRVQAINAVLEKERGQLKLEKMQLAQNMAAQMEEIHRLKQESDSIKGAHQAELEAQAARFRSDLEARTGNFTAELERAKSSLAAELTRKHADDTALLLRKQQEEAAEVARRHQEELSKLASAKQNELAAAMAARQSDLEVKLSQMRSMYESSMEEEKAALKRQFEAQLREGREALNRLTAASVG
jgi:DNA repair exonuclease SbcCD ATPase subunit